MQDFAPFTPELTGTLSFPQTPGRTATALCAVGQHVSRVEGPLHVVGGYQVKKLRGPAGYFLTFSYLYPWIRINQYNPNQNPMQVNCPFRVDHRLLKMETTYLIQILEMPKQKMQLKSMKSKSTHISMSLTSLILTILTKTGRQ